VIVDAPPLVYKDDGGGRASGRCLRLRDEGRGRAPLRLEVDGFRLHDNDNPPLRRDRILILLYSLSGLDYMTFKSKDEIDLKFQISNLRFTFSSLIPAFRPVLSRMFSDITTAASE
jgi:hypothetical protein